MEWVGGGSVNEFGAVMKIVVGDCFPTTIATPDWWGNLLMYPVLAQTGCSVEAALWNFGMWWCIWQKTGIEWWLVLVWGWSSWCHLLMTGGACDFIHGPCCWVRFKGVDHSEFLTLLHCMVLGSMGLEFSKGLFLSFLSSHGFYEGWVYLESSRVPLRPLVKEVQNMLI